jgi:hypothetical protein
MPDLSTECKPERLVMVASGGKSAAWPFETDRLPPEESWIYVLTVGAHVMRVGKDIVIFQEIDAQWGRA